MNELCTHRLRTNKRCGRPATIRLYYRAADGWRASNMFACATHQHLDIPSDSLRHAPLEPLAECACGHTAAQHHPIRFGSRCRACAQCLAFTQSNKEGTQ